MPRTSAAWRASSLLRVLVGASWLTATLTLPALATSAANPPMLAATLDPTVQAAVERARNAFLATQTFKRLNLAVWVQTAPGQPWRGGEVDATAQVYPASMVKLPFAIDAVSTCVESHRAPDCLQADVMPMLVDSDNLATGRLVDALTGTENHELPATDDTYARWLEARLHTERRLAAWGLLGGMRLLSKTYPSNSGDKPSGFEAQARATLGQNSMSAHDSAQLMRALIDGEIDRQSGAPVLATLSPWLTRPRFGLQSALAPGTPPGTRVLAKIGSAYDTLEEVAFIEVPQQPRVILAAFTNGFDQETPEPFDGWRLGGLTALVLQELHLVPPPHWRAPTQRRGTIARWHLPLASTFANANASTRSLPSTTSGVLEVQYRFPANPSLPPPVPGAPSPQRQVRLSVGTTSTYWSLPAEHTAARPLLLGEFTATTESVLTVEVELESPVAAAGEVLVQVLP